MAVKDYLLVFQPSGKRGHVQEGKTVMEAAQMLGEDIYSICGRRQLCGKCKVRIEEGSFAGMGLSSGQEHLSPPTEKELEHLGEAAITQGYRLACTAAITGELLIFIPEESRAKKQVVAKTTTQKATLLKPAVRKYYAQLEPPALEDPKGDWERLSEGLAQSFGLTKLDIDYQVLLSLSDVLRRGDWKVTATVWKEREVIKVEPGLAEKSFGLAIDIGTTTLAGYLCDLSTGQVLVEAAELNPQVSYGEDVISRITYATSSPGGLERLNSAVMEALNKLASRLAGEAGIATEDIIDVTVVGNTAMHHLFLKLNPQHLGSSPFTPVLHQPLEIKARDLGLKVNPAANMYILPIEAGFVGADNVAVLLAEEPYSQDEMVLLIDIGTNGELVLGNRQRLISASCATGPAFEGAQIKFGMRAAPGAIEKVIIDRQTGELKFKVVGEERWSDQKPQIKARGICGSGIIDVVAEMLHIGIIKPNGAFNKDIKAPRLLRDPEQLEFILAWPEETALGRELTITQKDIRAVQLAKGALLAGAKIIMEKLGIKQADKVILAGAFGLYIDKEKAMKIGLFPDCKLESVHSIGNAAGEGARLALLSLKKRREAAKIARGVEYVELTTEPGFSEEFIRSLNFPQ